MRFRLSVVLFAMLGGVWLLWVSREPPKPRTAIRETSQTQAGSVPRSFRDALLEEARTLAPDVAERIRQEVKAGGRDPQRRALLMAWLWHQGGPGSVLQRAEHLVWLIAHEPASEFLDWPPAWFSPGELGPVRMEEILAAWRSAVREHPDDPRPAWLAAKWFERHEERYFVEFLKASLEADPGFGPAVGALAEWCVRQLALQSPAASEARKLLETSLNPEIQIQAAQRFHQLAEEAEDSHPQRNVWRQEARRCYARARRIEPNLREEDVFSRAGRGANASLAGAPYASPEVQVMLNRGRRQMIRLPVEAFPDLPQAVAAALKRMGCAIPQAFESPMRRRAHNVIRGRFFRAERDSWAVLCSVRDTVRLLVFRDESDENPETLQGGLESACMQTTGADSAGFSWAITVADEALIRRYNSALKGPPLPPLEHEGIESHFLGKASVILYWHNGRWLRLQGAD